MRETDVFIIDEVSMVSRDILEIIDRTLRESTGNLNIPFGGKIILLGGDFRQTLPIKEKATPEQIMQIIVKASALWKHFKIFKLTQNMRANEDQKEFAKEILEIGEGKRNDAEDNVVIPDKYLFEGNLIEEIFGNQIDNQNIKQMANRAILVPTNKEADEINEQVLSLIDGEEVTYTSIDEIHEENNKKHRYVTEQMNVLNPKGIPKHKLVLKKNAIVMAMRNLDIDEGIVNGTRMRILETGTNILVCEVLSGCRPGRVIFIPRIKLECTKGKGLSVPFYRTQFPVKLCFAMTVNKSQGQTLDKVGLKLDQNELFAHGQLYVGCSRTRKAEDLKILLKSGTKKTKNIVHKSIL